MLQLTEVPVLHAANKQSLETRKIKRKGVYCYTLLIYKLMYTLYALKVTSGENEIFSPLKISFHSPHRQDQARLHQLKTTTT